MLLKSALWTVAPVHLFRPTMITILYGYDQPFQDTVFTGEHRVYCPLTQSYHCASDLPLVKVINYMQPLYVYNIIVHGQTHLMVNGLTVESLSHNNVNVQTRRNIVHVPKKAS